MGYLDLDNATAVIKEVVPIEVSTGSPDAGKIARTDATGRLDSSFFDLNTRSHDFEAIAAVDIAEGDLVNFFDNAGTLNIRKADNTLNRPAHGQIKTATLTGNIGIVINGSTLSKFTGLTIGTIYYLSVAGAITSVIPTTSGYVLQEIGIAISATRIKTENFEVIVLA